ncbi:hypothetical protein DUNSADRAFT_2869 [Dunaliella salina]|uniref:Uncharacterized protein n=1 Tax=Dunaliella salina TaxID=3046 RepID=A0ABQ7FW42_DUNSA|nr:hypothetical protein DUNSADRAFT_2869 [Dunaliella salina]|eukprot:KAF5826511.1 hypothetical protein DUNSADRAFT_2869 [Dunaliella salina]
MDLLTAAGAAGDKNDWSNAAAIAQQSHRRGPPARAKRHQSQPHPAEHEQQDMDLGMDGTMHAFDLPNVDDLEVAAAAAAAALDVLAPGGEEGEEEEEEETSSSDEEDSSSEEDNSSSSESEEEGIKPDVMAIDGTLPQQPQLEQQQQQQQPVRVALHTSPLDPSSVKLVLTVVDAAPKAGKDLQVRDSRKALKRQGRPDASGQEVEMDSSPLVSSDSESSSSSSEEEAEPMDYDQMQTMISKAYEVADEEDEEDGGKGGGGGKAGNALVSDKALLHISCKSWSVVEYAVCKL